MNICLSDEIVFHSREYRTYWQVISQLGGLLGVLTAVGRALVTYFASKTYNASLISKLFYDGRDLHTEEDSRNEAARLS